MTQEPIATPTKNAVPRNTQSSGCASPLAQALLVFYMLFLSVIVQFVSWSNEQILIRRIHPYPGHALDNRAGFRASRDYPDGFYAGQPRAPARSRFIRPGSGPEFSHCSWCPPGWFS